MNRYIKAMIRFGFIPAVGIVALVLGYGVAHGGMFALYTAFGRALEANIGDAYVAYFGRDPAVTCQLYVAGAMADMFLPRLRVAGALCGLAFSVMAMVALWALTNRASR